MDSSPEASAGTAKPSMAELANGGTSTSLVTASARIRPRASASGTSSADRGWTASSTIWRAVSTGSGSGTAESSQQRGSTRAFPSVAHRTIAPEHPRSQSA